MKHPVIVFLVLSPKFKYGLIGRFVNKEYLAIALVDGSKSRLESGEIHVYGVEAIATRIMIIRTRHLSSRDL